MSASARYPVPAATHRGEQDISRSRFITTIGRVSTVEEAQAFIRAVAVEFSDATHNCWAYVVGPPGDTGRIGMSERFSGFADFVDYTIVVVIKSVSKRAIDIHRQTTSQVGREHVTAEVSIWKS